MKAKLLITNGSMSGISISLEKDLLIGRDKKCGLILKDEGIGQKHCSVVKEHGLYYVKHLNEKYRTLVNKKLISKYKLNPLDTIQVGAVALQFMEIGEDLAIDKTEFADRDESFGEINKLEDEDDPRKIGNYIVINHLGTGATGDVFKAENIESHEKVALKILHNQEIDKNVLKRFLQEAQICSQFDHSKIVKVLEFGMFKNRPLIVMEYIEGISLEQHIKKKGAFTEIQALKIAGQIAQALNYTHQKGVIHRDLKPSNILLVGKKNIKVIDFGVIKVFGNSITFANQMIGTIRYIPPEQIDDASSVDERADIYALGAILYFLVSGKVPFFQIEGLESLIMNIGAESLVPLSEIVPGISEQFCLIIATAMQKKAEKRYQNITEMFSAIINTLQNIK